MSRTYVVPDIHGMSNHLDRALSEIASREPNAGHRVIFLGDYIDRGPASARVVKIIRDGIAAAKPWVALKGNHEDFMAASVLGAHESMTWSWLQNGGTETLASYGGDQDAVNSDAAWMAALPAYTEDAHRVYVHAFAPEQHVLADAPQEAMLWTRYPEGADVGYRGRHVVHGHTPKRNGPELLSNRTNLDCGAVFYGRLVVGIFDDTKAGGPIGTFEITGATP
jgi:serine/threonine protein phosphatase 1